MDCDNALNLTSWVNYYHPLHLTKYDIDLLEIGDSIEVAVFDRDMNDKIVYSGNYNNNERYSPEQMFADCRCLIDLISINPHKWDLQYRYGTYEHYLELDTASTGTKWAWYPLNADDTIELRTTIVDWKITNLPEPIIKPWCDFDDDTRVGFRGPIMRWENLEDLREVYFE